MSDYRPIVREAVEAVKSATVAELRKVAEDLGIDHKGLKKPDLEAAIAANQTQESPAAPAETEESA